MRSKLQKLWDKFSGTSKGEADFDIGIEKIKAQIQEIVTDKAMERGGLKFEQPNFEPIFSSINSLKENFQKGRVELSKELEDKIQELETIGQTDSDKFNQITNEINTLRNDLVALEQKDTGLSALRQEILLNIESIGKQITSLNENQTDSRKEVKALQDLIENNKVDFLNKLNNIGGGNMNRQIKVNGVDVLKKYTDINFIGSITTSVDETDKNVDITFAGGSVEIGGTVTGGTEGSVLFLGPAGVLAQDNTNFFFDDTTNTLKVNSLLFAPVVLQKADGTMVAYGQSAASDATRGTAMISAQTAAVAGETIFVYANATPTASLGKNGVNWWFAPGVTVTNNSATLWSDGGAAKTFNVDGDGTFLANGVNCLSVTHASSVIRIKARKLSMDSGGQSCVYTTAGTIYLDLTDGIYSWDYDAIETGGGTVYFNAYTVYGGSSGGDDGEAIEVYSSGVVKGSAYEFKSSAGKGILNYGTGGTIDIVAHNILGGQHGVVSESGTTKVTAEYISSNTNTYSTVDIGSTGIVEIIGAEINSSTAAAATITVGNNNLTLRNVNIVTKSTETNSITAGSAYTVNVIGTLTTNKLISTNITIINTPTLGTKTVITKPEILGTTRITGVSSTTLTGTANPTASTTLVGTGTLFLTELYIGDRITINGETRTVTAIASDTSLTVNAAFTDTASASIAKLSAILITRLSNNNIGLVQNDLGNVGIGVSNFTPLAKLHMSNGTLLIDGTSAMVFGTAGLIYSAFSLIMGDSSQNDLTYRTYRDHIWQTDTGDGTAGTQRFIIKGTTGLVGIGVTPSAVLTLKAGTATASTAPIKLTMAGSVVLTTPETGVMETSTDNVYLTKKTAIRESIPGVIFTQTADKAVTNTVTETSIIGTGVGTLTLPANFFVAGKTIRVTMSGVYSTVAVTGDTITVKVKYGSTVLTTKATTALVTGATDLYWESEVLITCRTTGASGTVQISGGITYQIAGAVTVEDELNNGAATTTIDTTASSLLDITVTHSAANASNSVKSLVGSFEVLN